MWGSVADANEIPPPRGAIQTRLLGFPTQSHTKLTRAQVVMNKQVIRLIHEVREGAQ